MQTNRDTASGPVIKQGMEYCIVRYPKHPHDTWTDKCCQPDEVPDPPETECPQQPPRDIMEPRQYYTTAKTWKGIPLPFSDPRDELLLPGNRETMSLIPSMNPFTYTGRKSNWRQERPENPPMTALPVSAKRPELFGFSASVDGTTNHLGYRPQRRHYAEPPSLIVYN